MILAGGIGRRLRPLTYVLPKPMIPVGDKPLLEHQIEYFKRHSIRKFVIATGYLGKIIEDYFEDGARWNVEIKYARGNRPLGTAGQLKTAEPFINGTFVAINGDIIISVDLRKMIAFHQKSEAFSTIALRPFRTRVPYGIIKLREENRIESWQEKPEIDLIMNVGLYVLEREVFCLIPADHVASLERETFPMMINKGYKLLGFISDTEYFDVTDMNALEKVNNRFFDRPMP